MEGLTITEIHKCASKMTKAYARTGAGCARSLFLSLSFSFFLSCSLVPLVGCFACAHAGECERASAVTCTCLCASACVCVRVKFGVSLAARGRESEFANTRKRELEWPPVRSTAKRDVVVFPNFYAVHRGVLSMCVLDVDEFQFHFIFHISNALDVS